MSIIKQEIGTGIELLIEGLPAAVMTPANLARAGIELASHSIPFGADVTAGLLGGIRYATLRIGSESYTLKYSLIVIKPMRALQVYSEAIAWIEYQKGRNADPVLADQAIAYIRGKYAKEFPG